MDKKIIFVNATSATVGGSLTILRQFTENVKKNRDKSKKYYIFVPIDCEIQSTDYFEIVTIKAKSYKDRIIWDLYGIKIWSRKECIYPNLIISLQNTGVRFNRVNQIIYLHQPLPYAKESKWNPIKKDERKMWFYKNLYKVWIDLSIKKYHKIIVQTQWMKDALIKEGYNTENIILSQPNVTAIDKNKIDSIEKEKDKYYFFYPASDYKYKNHITIIKALNLLRNNNINLFNKIKVIFTLNEESKIYDEVLSYNLESNIDFLGNLKYEQVLEYYKISDVVLFPSYIETFGLPLIEGSMFGKKILVSDCSYSKELIGGYELAEFIEYDNVVKWSNAIEKSIETYSEKPTSLVSKNGWNKVFNLINLEIS